MQNLHLKCINQPFRINSDYKYRIQSPRGELKLSSSRAPLPGDVALQQCMLGMEFSGRDPSGRRVMGLLPAKGLATCVDADRRFLWDVPSSW